MIEAYNNPDLLLGGKIFVDQQTRRLMKKIEENSHVSMDEIVRIAEAVQYSDLSDERTVRTLVRQLTALANRSISPEKEDEIVRSILNQSVPTSIDELQKYFK